MLKDNSKQRAGDTLGRMSPSWPRGRAAALTVRDPGTAAWLGHSSNFIIFMPVPDVWHGRVTARTECESKFDLQLQSVQFNKSLSPGMNSLVSEIITK